MINTSFPRGITIITQIDPTLSQWRTRSQNRSARRRSIVEAVFDPSPSPLTSLLLRALEILWPNVPSSTLRTKSARQVIVPTASA